MRFRRMNPVYSRLGDMDSDNDISVTYGGVTQKTAVLLGIISIIALYLASILDFSTGIQIPIVTIIIAPIVAIVSVILAHRNVQLAWVFSLVYATMEGVFLGFISALVAHFYGTDVVMMALLATFGVLAGMLFLYSTGLIRVGNFFRRAMYSMLMGLVFTTILYIIIYMMGGLGGTTGYGLYIAIVIVSVIISSLYLLVDFDSITNLVEAGAPKEYEWMLSLGLVVTIVWLYIELLRFIAIIYRKK